MRASTSPWRTSCPSRSGTSSTSPPTLDFKVACTIGDIDPESGSERDKVCSSTDATSTDASSSGGVSATLADATAAGSRIAIHTITATMAASSPATTALTRQSRPDE